MQSERKRGLEQVFQIMLQLMKVFRIQPRNSRITEKAAGFRGFFQFRENCVFPVGIDTLIILNQSRQFPLFRLHSGTAEHRSKMGKDHPRAAPFHQNAFPDAIGNIRIEAYHIAAENRRSAGPRKPQLFSGKPFLRTVPSEMNHGIGAEHMPQIEVNRHILVRRSKCSGMVKLIDIAEVSAHRFRQDSQISAKQDRDYEPAVFRHDR